MITDCHVHIAPMEQFKPEALALIKAKRKDFEQIERFCQSPSAFLKHMDEIGIDRAVLINYVAPEVIGFTAEVNEWVANYVKTNPKRLIPCGSVHPRHTKNVLADMEQIVRLGIKLIKIHPPHQLLYPNDYLNGVKELEIIYRAAEANGIPIMVHTGTSIFPGARNKFGDPIYVDDVAVDFPKLKILLAHGGRPLWMDSAFFLVRRHPNVLSRHQRDSAEDAAELFSAAGRDRAQDAFRNRLAGAGGAGDREQPCRVPQASTDGSSQASNPFAHGAGSLAGVIPSPLPPNLYFVEDTMHFWCKASETKGLWAKYYKIRTYERRFLYQEIKYGSLVFVKGNCKSCLNSARIGRITSTRNWIYKSQACREMAASVVFRRVDMQELPGIE